MSRLLSQLLFKYDTFWWWIRNNFIEVLVVTVAGAFVWWVAWGILRDGYIQETCAQAGYAETIWPVPGIGMDAFCVDVNLGSKTLIPFEEVDR